MKRITFDIFLILKLWPQLIPKLFYEYKVLWSLKTYFALDKDTPWIPQHKIMLNRIEGSGEYAPTKALLGIKSMLFYVTTEVILSGIVSIVAR